MNAGKYEFQLPRAAEPTPGYGKGVLTEMERLAGLNGSPECELARVAKPRIRIFFFNTGLELECKGYYVDRDTPVDADWDYFFEYGNQACMWRPVDFR
jgi:hypothetical protein